MGSGFATETRASERWERDGSQPTTSGRGGERVKH